MRALKHWKGGRSYGLGVVRFGVFVVTRIAVFGHLEEKTPLWSRLSKCAFYLWRDRGAVAKAGETPDVRLDLWPAQPGAGVPPVMVQKARHRCLHRRTEGQGLRASEVGQSLALTRLKVGFSARRGRVVPLKEAKSLL